ncbi:MAG: YggS family pyridoxal phosphate-dependent enzyme [Bacteroidales bacterium]|nr:YggS family pyridoxal phosphate-dependent enzyme [Bacteroidales bacterium]
MTDLDSIKKLILNLPPGLKLVAVSKFKPIQEILLAYNEGIRDFAESRPQELKQKMDILPGDIRWHFIGHLQSNKIKMIIERVSLIHSVDSLKLLWEIDKEAGKRGLVKDILLQVFIASEETKQGLNQDELKEILDQKGRFPNIRFCGLMGMASFTLNRDIIRGEFAGLKDLFDRVKREYFAECNNFCELSMGMSGDYQIAAEEGSTIVRIGSLIFGDR